MGRTKEHKIFDPPKKNFIFDYTPSKILRACLILFLPISNDNEKEINNDSLRNEIHLIPGILIDFQDEIF